MTLLHQSQGYESPTNQIQFLWEPLKEVGLYAKVRDTDDTLAYLLGDRNLKKIMRVYNYVEFFALFQINCISTEFTPKKHGGEKGKSCFILETET